MPLPHQGDFFFISNLSYSNFFVYKAYIDNFSLELKQSKTPPAVLCWIIATLVSRYVFFNPRLCKSWDCPNLIQRAPVNLITLYTFDYCLDCSVLLDIASLFLTKENLDCSLVSYIWLLLRQNI